MRLTILLLFLTFVCHAQSTDNIVDVLKKEILKTEKEKEGYRKDTTLAVQYAILARVYIDESADSLLKYQKKAVLLARKTNHKKALGLSELALGTYYRENGYYSEAIKHYNNATKIFGNKFLKEKAETLSHLGILYTYTDQYLKAIEYHKKSQAIFTRLNLINGIVDNEANIGNAYLENGHPAKALPYFKDLEKIYDTKESEIEDINGHKCVNYINICTSYLRLNQFERAKPFIDSSYKYCNMIYGIAEKQYLLKELTDYFIKNHNYKEALLYLSQSDSLVSLLQSDLKKMENLNLRYQIYKAENNTDSALVTLEKYITLYQKLNLDKSNAEVKFDTHSKQKELERIKDNSKKTTIILIIFLLILLSFLTIHLILNNLKLKRKNREISDAMLMGQIKERKKVASDLHDSIGGNLSSLKWTLDAIQKEKLDTHQQEMFDHALKTLNGTYNQVKFLAHHLLPDELNKFGLWFTLEQLVRKLNKTYNIQFYYSPALNLPILTPKIAFEIYCILLELINNAIINTRSENVTIKFKNPANEIISLIFKQDRIGFTESLFQNIIQRTEAINGKCTIEKENAEYYMLRFIFPLG